MSGFKSTHRQAKTIFLILLALITLIGGAARLYRLEEKSLWSDEVATIATSLGNGIDPQAYRLRGESFDPPEPVSASAYAQKATQSHGMGNFARTNDVLKANVHPPLFFWLMNLWIHAFGLSPAMLRLPAALFGILCIPLMAWLALQISDLNNSCVKTRWAEGNRYGFALLAAAFMAFSAYQVDHAQDARQYTFLLLIAMLSVGIAARLIHRLRNVPVQTVSHPDASLPDSNLKTCAPQTKTSPCQHHPANQCQTWPLWLALAMLLAMGLYTQYFFMVFAGFILLVLAWHGRRNKPFLLKLGLAVALVGLLLLPWLEIFQVQMAFFKTAGHYTAGLWNPVRLPEKLWRIVCEFFLPKNVLGKFVPLLVLLAAMLAGRLHCRQPAPSVLNDPASRPSASWAQFCSPVLLLILLWLGLVIGGQVLLDILKHTHTATIRRYLFLASPAAYLLMAYTLVWSGFAGRTPVSPEQKPPTGITGLDKQPVFSERKNLAEDGYQRMADALSRLGISGGNTPVCWWKLLATGFTVLMLALMAGDTTAMLFRKHTSSDEFKQAATWINQTAGAGDRVLVNKSGAMAVGMALYLKPDTRMLGVDVQDVTELDERSPLMQRLGTATMGSRRIWLVFSHAARSTEFHLKHWLAAKGYHEVETRRYPGVKVFLFSRR